MVTEGTEAWQSGASHSLFQPNNSVDPSILPQAESQTDLTLPLGGSRGTSWEGLILQLNPSRTIPHQMTDSVPLPHRAVPLQRPFLRVGDSSAGESRTVLGIVPASGWRPVY